MRRMIPGKLIDSVKKLSTSVNADGEGNLEVGKNLEVDGKTISNGIAYPIILLLGHAFGVDKETSCIAIADYGLSSCYLLTNFGYFLATKENGELASIDDVVSGDFDHEKTEATQQNFNIKSYFNHSLTIKTGSGESIKTYYADVTLTKNDVIDSPQDLTTYLGKSKKVGIGTAQLAYDSTAKIWKVGTESVTSVADSVTTI